MVITVLAGGPSGEREVSLESGEAVARALRRCGHHVSAADITPEDTSALDRPGVDVVFIALHGAFGEDGEVQRLCEARGVTYVGSGPEASRLAMNKDAAKRAFRRASLATPDWVTIDASQGREDRLNLLGELALPCVVKPVGGGSSLDVTIARDAAARQQAVESLLGRYGRAMVEAFIPGRELTVGVLGDQPLPVVEIIPRREFYDYVAKYQDDETVYVCPADLPPALAEHLRAAGLVAHRALGCRDFSRVDFILADDGTAYVLEVNTIPGFTSHSLLPKAAAAAGISFEQLCDRIVRLALARHGR
ncbi:MAG: hypothetical protein B1H04_04220 [Planctomycetales bacterium 4484_123]|nr:MAG: hypothetical protein B1H04_04220 [Planctomycetales bacterium 4484_123]